MVTSEYTRTALGETYEDVHGLICRMANVAAMKFGGTPDDYISAGNEAFMEACISYKQCHGAAFSTWLWWKIKGAIKDEMRQRRGTVPCAQLPTDYDEFVAPSSFDAEAFGNELSDDASLVARMILDSASELMEFIHHDDARETIREGLARRLSNLGWTMARIAESFIEIGEALG